VGPAVACLPLCLLPQLLWALVHAGYPLDPLFLQQLLAATRRQMGQAGRQDLGQLAWALGKLRAAPEPAWVEAFCEAVLQVGGRWGGGCCRGHRVPHFATSPRVVVCLWGGLPCPCQQHLQQLPPDHGTCGNHGFDADIRFLLLCTSLM
jgi:hypothetical protein